MGAWRAAVAAAMLGLIGVLGVAGAAAGIAAPPPAASTDAPDPRRWGAAPRAVAARGGADQAIGREIVTVPARRIRLHVEEGLEGLARALAGDRAAYAPMPGIGDPLAVLPGPPDVWVVSDLSRVPGPGPGGETWVAGFADAGRNLIALRAGEEGPGDLGPLRRTFRHELAHLALSAATGGRAPRWLHEGYAQIAAGDWDWQQAWRLRVALFRDEGDALQRLSLDFPAREPDARVAYLLSFTAVHELLRMGGPAGLSTFFQRLREGRTVDAALRDVYALTVDQFEERWRKSVENRYGWLYLLSRASVFWVLLTIALLALGWRRWRYQKERWEELRRQDEAEARWWREFWGRTPDAPPGSEGPAGSGRPGPADGATPGEGSRSGRIIEVEGEGEEERSREGE